MSCNQKSSSRRNGDGETVCGKPGAYRYTWPGNDEAEICQEHTAHLRGVARALGLHLQLIPINEEEPTE